jgi:cyclase
MMQRERVTEDIFVFTSELYVQVTAGLVVTSEGVVVIDTLLYPEESLNIKQFIETRLKLPVKYVINTHHHADHTIIHITTPTTRQVLAFLKAQL